MIKSAYPVKNLAVGAVELAALYGANALIARYFPHWVPKATINLTQREFASWFSAAALIGAVASFGLLDGMSKAQNRLQASILAETTVDGSAQVKPAPLLRIFTMGIDAASFIWSIRACTDTDSTVASLIGMLAYLSLPRIFARSVQAKHPQMSAQGALVVQEAPLQARAEVRHYAKAIALTSTIGMLCIALSIAITTA